MVTQVIDVKILLTNVLQKGLLRFISLIKQPRTTLLGMHGEFVFYSTFFGLYSVHMLIISRYYIRPGFRERLVVSNCEILTDRFFKLFASSFRLLWPFSISDAYEFDFLSGQYGFTNGFLSHIRDISVWTMSREFFQEFPELEDDMTVESPVCVQLPDTLKKDTKQGML